MKFLLDHDVPDDLAFSLGALGHPVVKVREIMPATATDDEVLHFAHAQERILIGPTEEVAESWGGGMEPPCGG